MQQPAQQPQPIQQPIQLPMQCQTAPVQAVQGQMCSADGAFFQPPPGYMMCVLPVGMQVPPGAVLVPVPMQMMQQNMPQAEPCGQSPANGNQMFQGSMCMEAGGEQKLVHQAAEKPSPAASVVEPAPEPATEEQPTPANADLERRKRLLRLSGDGAASGTSAAVLLAKRMQIMQARRSDRSTTFSALNIDQRQEKKAPQLRFLKELEEKKKQLQSAGTTARDSCTSASTATPASDEEVSTFQVSDRDETAAAAAPAVPPQADFAQARSVLMSYRGLASGKKPQNLKGFFVDTPVEPEFVSLPELRRQRSAPAPAPATPQHSMRRQRTEPAPKTLSPLAAQRRELSELETLRREVNSLLNKVCPEKFGTVVEKLTAIKVDNTEALEIIIELIFKKALSEPHYSETYADLVFSLRSAFPEFPSPDGGKPMTFKSSVLSICQAEFEELLAAPEPSESEKAGCDGDELQMLCQERRGRMRANMRFVGHLFLRQLLSAKVTGGILRELVLCEMQDMAPQEHAIECACELLSSVGFTLEAMPAGQAALPMVFERLRSLKVMKNEDGKALYTKRVQFMIQDMIDIREAGWTRKVFRSSAKTKEEIRAALPQQEQSGETVVVGQRPLYLTGEVERFIRTHTA